VLKNQKWHLKARFSDSKFQEAVINKWGCKLWIQCSSPTQYGYCLSVHIFSVCR